MHSASTSMPITGHAIKRQSPPPTPNHPPHRDIFDTLDHWLTSPSHAYSSWLARQPLRDSTKTVYIAMFGRFCQWLNEQNRTLDHLKPSDIAMFLETVNPNLPESRKKRCSSGRQRQQYVRQLEKVFAHLGVLGHGGENPGRKAAYERIGAGSDKPTRFLTAAESKAVMRLVQTKLDELRREEKSIDAWIEYRDLALIGVMMGGGLKVNHIARVTLNCMDMAEQRIDLSEHEHAHHASLLPFAVRAVTAWLSVLAQMHGGKLATKHKVFEADRSSGFGRNSKIVTLSAASIHRRIQRLLGMAGITGDRACAQTLRNTYAGLLIDGGATDKHLVDCLGLYASATAHRLRTAYKRFQAKRGADSPERSTTGPRP